MQSSGFMLFRSVLATAVAALSLGPSFAHLLGSGPGLNVWSPELWREATVSNQQFKFFVVVGAPLDIAAIIVPAVFISCCATTVPPSALLSARRRFRASIDRLVSHRLAGQRGACDLDARADPRRFRCRALALGGGPHNRGGPEALGFISLSCAVATMHRVV